VLRVSTTSVLAQLKPIEPADKRIHWRWVGLGVLVILGMMTFLLGTFLFVASTTISAEENIRDLSALIDEYLGLAIAGTTSFLLSFGVGGMAITWLANRRAILEPAIAAAAVLALLAIVGWTLTKDAPLVAAALALPAAALAALGGRLGEMLPRGEGKQ